ncbi:unnamed protein product [Effrenium voratum]|nr:unnamed protein product [Effrenium voratum]
MTDWAWLFAPWRPEGRPEKSQGLILLNTPLSKPLLETLWHMTSFRLLADGAATRLRASHPEFVPDAVLGDLDSADAETLQWYRERGVQVRDLSHDQDTTDLEKCLAAARQDFACEQVLVAGQFAGLEGRLDHTMAAFNALLKAQRQGLHAALLSDDCCCAVLLPGPHRLDPLKGGSVGLVPLGAAVKVSSSGLKYNLQDETSRESVGPKMLCRGLISNSNSVDEEGDGIVWAWPTLAKKNGLAKDQTKAPAVPVQPGHIEKNEAPAVWQLPPAPSMAPVVPEPASADPEAAEAEAEERVDAASETKVMVWQKWFDHSSQKHWWCCGWDHSKWFYEDDGSWERYQVPDGHQAGAGRVYRWNAETSECFFEDTGEPMT